MTTEYLINSSAAYSRALVSRSDMYHLKRAYCEHVSAASASGVIFGSFLLTSMHRIDCSADIQLRLCCSLNIG